MTRENANKLLQDVCKAFLLGFVGGTGKALAALLIAYLLR